MSKRLYQLTVEEILAGLEAGDFTSGEVTKAFWERIERYNGELNVFLVVNGRAVEQAGAADEERAKGSKKRLLGLPVAIKDNFMTRGMPSTASSKVLEGFVPEFESTVTKRLLDEGAVFLGKTNLDAWAHGSSTETSQFGPTLNPWDLGRLPGGSSGGSAAAVAAQLAPVAIGTETAGSIRQPAAWCGVTGFKPTYGRVSRFGAVAMASSTDSPGPLAKNIRDCAVITEIIAGRDPYDGTSSALPVEEYTAELKLENLQGMKIGLVKEYLVEEMESEVKKVILEAADVFRSLGAEVVEVSLLDPKYSIGVYTVIQRAEVSSNLARYDGIRYGKGRELFGEEAKRRIMLGTYTLSAGYYDAFYKKAQQVRTKIVEDFEKVFKEVDLVIGPVSPGVALKVGASKNQPMFGEIEDRLVEPSSIAGLTSAGVPCGFVGGLPIGLQITGPQFNESKVLAVADLFQRKTDFIKTPKKYE